MPIYEYACAACGHKFEEWQKMSDPPVRTCPKCKKKKVEKLISQTAFQLKGGGWYSDLYSSSKKPSGGGESKSDASSSTKSESSGGGESKSSAKESPKESKKDSAKASPAKKAESRAA